jgi:hypothetical protein
MKATQNYNFKLRIKNQVKQYFLSSKMQVVSLLLLVSATLVVYLIYWPALSGPFLLDDNLHLPKLRGDDGQIDTWLEVLELTFSGSGASGRPLSFLSLLINDNAWPTEPFGFKYTNLCFHVINSLLLFLLVFRLILIFGVKNYALLIATFVSISWLLHPINISAVLFSIQRMTILMATCNILGLIIYSYGRFSAEFSIFKRYFFMLTGLGVGLGLGILFKETAVMLVIYLIGIEFLAMHLNNHKALPYLPVWRKLLWLPLFFVAIYFFYSFEHMQHLYVKRNFDHVERLMTEWRVLVDYIRLIYLPKISEMGPYHDDYLVSRGLLEPYTTLLSLLVILTVCLSAYFFRNRLPLLYFAVFCFFGAHLLESTILPLELYYEHRNYLPSIVLIILVFYSIIYVSKKLKPIIYFSLSLWLLGLIFVTWSSVTVWADNAKLSNIWVVEKPLSSRARLDAIKYALNTKDINKAFDLLEEGVRLKPKDAGLYVYGFVVQHCNSVEDVNSIFTLETLKQVIPYTDFDHGSMDAIKWLIKHNDSRCQLDLDTIEALIKLYLKNPKFYGVPSARAVLYHALSTVYKQKKDLSATIIALEQAYAARNRYEFALQAAYFLAMAENFDEADHFLQLAQNTKPDNLLMARVQKERIQEIKEIIELKKSDTQQKILEDK